MKDSTDKRIQYMRLIQDAYDNIGPATAIEVGLNVLNLDAGYCGGCETEVPHIDRECCLCGQNVTPINEQDQD